MTTAAQNKLTMPQVSQLQAEQDAFWDEYERYIHSNEDMLGKFCRRHGRSVKAYPRLPSTAPSRLTGLYRIVYDIQLQECYMCCLEDDCGHITDLPNVVETPMVLRCSDVTHTNCSACSTHMHQM
ncbi:U2 protein [Pea yellow stunt virus]|uniref:U2 protein n=1 Tax=Pea yellow stunt virus TaxID=1436892 RepID=V9TRX8_9VIRU|nr:U2 protein [Pea yellow stunt virus]AHC72286.1 U2 protein [Pea yellow stunt virus]